MKVSDFKDILRGDVKNKEEEKRKYF